MFITLSQEQGRVAQAVRTEGYAVTSVSALLPDSECYAALRDVGLTFAGSSRVQECHAAFLRGDRRETLKQFLVKYQDKQHFDGKHPLFRFGLAPAIHQTACACLGRTLQSAGACLGNVLTYYSADLWCVLPDSQEKPREWSQSWHRDPEAERLIKVFLFLEDVTNDSGPFEFVAGSHDGGLPELCPPRRYPAHDIDPLIPAAAKRRFVAPAGTIVFANTSGLHRGGYTRNHRRLNCIFTFLPDSRPAKFTLESVPLDLSEIQRQALSLN